MLKVKVVEIVSVGSESSEPIDCRSTRKDKTSYFIPVECHTYVTLKTGERYGARIIDVSRHGMIIETELLKVKDVMLVGTTKVQHVRRVRAGEVAVRFAKPLGFKLRS